MLTASLAVFFSLVAAPPPLSEDPAYQEGMRLYDAFEYERATFRFKEALRIAGRSDADRATIYLRLGMTYAELRDDESAMEAFMDALDADPLLVLPDDAAPKIKALLDDARRAVRKKREAAARAPKPPTSPAPSPSPTPPVSAPASPAPSPAAPGAPGTTRAPVSSADASRSGASAPKAAPDSAVSSTPAPPPSSKETLSTEPSSTERARSAPRHPSTGEGGDAPIDANTDEIPEVASSGLPWLLTAAGISGGLAAVTLVGAVGSWGAGLYFVQVALNATYQDDAKIAADLAWLGQVVGQLLMIPGVFLLVGAVGFGVGAYFVE